MNIKEMKAELKKWRKLDMIQYCIIKSDFINELMENGYTKDAAEAALAI